ncbi:helix-turn-helix transcriptional regulator [Streptomyces chartreusis]|uniref:helix-turn-helix transcriptional regulator n=1 Tax=Streptomyces chartreusis TaxID=1969 RepID=UPI00371C3B3D
MIFPDTLRDFLTSRRTAIEPADVGLPPSPVPRRGKGLRREEVAVLAGVSVDYYARLEQGRVGHVSDQVLTAIEDALRLDDHERQHLRALVEPRPSRPRSSRPERISVRAGLRTLINAMDPTPAVLQGPRLEVLAWNRAAAALLTDFGAMPVADRNIARWLFLDPEARMRYPQWDEVARGVVAALRAARDPRVPDPALERLVGELSVASEEFARFWADYRLYKHGHGTKDIYHESVGTITVNFETFLIDRSEGQFISAYTVNAGSPSEERLALLMSWDATVKTSGAAQR